MKSTDCIKFLIFTVESRDNAQFCKLIHNVTLNLNHFFFEACAKVAAKHQIKTYVVGGWVRDQLLNRPSKDIDIVVEGNGMDFAQKVAQEIDTNIQVNFFKTFGTREGA